MIEGWKYDKLENLLTFNQIGLIKSKKDQGIDKEFAYFKMDNIGNDNSLLDNDLVRVDASPEEVDKFGLKDEDFLFNTRNSFELVGKTCLYLKKSEEPVLFNNNIMRMRFIDELLPAFAAYSFKSRQVSDQLEKMKSGTTSVVGIYFKSLKNLELPIPPLQEQKQIVKILDEAFAAIDQAKANIEKNIENAQELFQSKLNEIFSQPALSAAEGKGDGWESDKLINLTSKIGSGSTPRGGQKSYKAEGISLIRSMNVHDDRFEPNKLAFIDEGQADKLKNVVIEEEDVLLNITGASVARCCVVDKDYLPARVNQHVSIIRPIKEKLDSAFLHLSLISKPNKDELLGIGEQGATRQAITKSQIEQFIVDYPKSLSEQKKISEALEIFKTSSQALEDKYEEKLELMDELKKSILQKAFSGELTSSANHQFEIKPLEEIQGISPTDLQAGITAIAMNRHIESGNEHYFHHVKAEKVVHLAEYVLGIDLKRNPVKDAAGPNDFKHSKKVESRAKKAGFYQVTKQGDFYKYSSGRQFSAIIDKTTTALNNRVSKLDELLKLLLPMKAQQAEILATVYAAWNNLLLEKESVTDEKIVSEARENWHTNKMNIPRNNFFKAIEWMKKHEILIPKGNGKIVKTKKSKPAIINNQSSDN